LSEAKEINRALLTICFFDSVGVSLQIFDNSAWVGVKVEI